MKNLLSLDAGLQPAFLYPVFDSQAVFRSALSAVAYPGRIVDIDRSVPTVGALHPSTIALCLSLIDFETPAWLDGEAGMSEASTYLRFHCGMRFVDNPALSRFAIIAQPAVMPHLSNFKSGEIEYPDRSTTLIIQVPSLAEGPRTMWTGPGIKDRISPAIAGLPNWFWPDWALNRELYPMGVDVFFTSGGNIIGLPRTVHVEA